MPRQTIASSAAIAAGHPQGAMAGLEMLREGGNAVDAAVAATLAMCVAVPGSVGLGGYGGSAVVYLACQRRTFAIDFDSRAPRGFRDGLVTADPQSSCYGARSVTAPAVVAGLDLVLREFGKKAWREVLRPAIQLAEEGFDVDPEHKRYLSRCAAQFDRQSLASLFPGAVVPEIGDRWRQPDQARLLRRLAEEGPAAFYEGDIPRSIVRYLQDRGGILTEEDFRCCRPQIVEPLHVTCCGYELYTPPPPSGGITSLGIIQSVARFDPHNMQPWGGPYFHILAETMKVCWQERHRYLGDPDYIEVPVGHLLSEQAAAARANQIRSAVPIASAHALNPSPHTANVIAMDAEQNLISLTATQGWMYGSHLVVDGLGLVLNHGMSRFDYVAGHPNAPAPGKRMQHNMSPLVALRDALPAFAIGMPGGPKIVSVTAQLALDLMSFGATPAAAIAAPRVHTDGTEPLSVSAHMPARVTAELEKFDHAIRFEDDMGGPVNVMAIEPPTRRINVASADGSGAVAGM